MTIWGDVLAALATDPEELVGKVDWITKRWLLRQFCEQEDIPWSHPWLKSQDLEYHQIDPARSLGLALARTPAGLGNSAQGNHASRQPSRPANTRAAIRSQAMRLLKDEGCAYYIDWEIIGAEGGNSLHMLNPFDSGCPDAESWVNMLNGHTARNPRSGRVTSNS